MEHTNRRQYKKGKLPLFVTIYEKLYDNIISGEYEPGQQLPNEPDLAKQFNVSRGTLRQALLFLQEDRLIVNKQGKGNFVLEKKDTYIDGVEVLSNNILDFCHFPITKIDHNLVFQPANKKQKNALNLSSTEIVAFLDSYFYVEEKIAALNMIFIPYSMLISNKVEIGEAENIYNFYCEFLKTHNLHSKTEMQVVYARVSTAQKMHINENDPLLMIEETFFTHSEPLLTTKTYLMPDFFRLPIHRKNDWKSLGLSYSN